MSTETTDVAMLGKNQWRHVLGLILASLIMSDRVAGASFEAKGILNIKTIDIQNLQSELELNFDVSVAGCQWFIATAHHPMSDSHDISNWEIGSEGSNEIYQVAFYNKATLNPKSINDSIGFLEQDKVPQNVQGNTAAEIWLAFASACYMEHVTNNMLEPVYGLPALLRDQGFTERSIYEIFEATLFTLATSCSASLAANSQSSRFRQLLRAEFLELNIKSQEPRISAVLRSLHNSLLRRR